MFFSNVLTLLLLPSFKFQNRDVSFLWVGGGSNFHFKVDMMVGKNNNLPYLFCFRRGSFETGGEMEGHGSDTTRQRERVHVSVRTSDCSKQQLFRVSVRFARYSSLLSCATFVRGVGKNS